MKDEQGRPFIVVREYVSGMPVQLLIVERHASKECELIGISV